MRKGRKPYENKTDLDAGRMRNRIQFYNEEWVDDNYGGGSMQSVLVLDTWCEKRTPSLNSLSQLGLIAAETGLVQSYYVSYRTRKGFTPTRDMAILLDGEPMTFLGFIPTDNPQTITKILCSVTNLEVSPNV